MVILAAKIRIFIDPDFDYDGEIDVDYYEEKYPIEKKRYMLYGESVIGGLNWDLQTMTVKWKSFGYTKLEPIIRAQRQLIEDLLEGL